ncbi:hypothetical protein BJ508DRAFT_361267 [Ascobolus immersus RN42]|uniref:Uncharacterized protein n=1 Tax=Ascobolus immersus RN42 TaxID=1160509 RepID=A0A3N4I8C5_ASCIM|nr:hypothetical protein BJ508DRAFT_361267 [Ascobolus immersus RN42]
MLSRANFPSRSRPQTQASTHNEYIRPNINNYLSDPSKSLFHPRGRRELESPELEDLPVHPAAWIQVSAENTGRSEGLPVRQTEGENRGWLEGQRGRMQVQERVENRRVEGGDRLERRRERVVVDLTGDDDKGQKWGGGVIDLTGDGDDVNEDGN